MVGWREIPLKLSTIVKVAFCSFSLSRGASGIEAIASSFTGSSFLEILELFSMTTISGATGSIRTGGRGGGVTLSLSKTSPFSVSLIIISIGDGGLLATRGWMGGVVGTRDLMLLCSSLSELKALDSESTFGRVLEAAD